MLNSLTWWNCNSSFNYVIYSLKYVVFKKYFCVPCTYRGILFYVVSGSAFHGVHARDFNWHTFLIRIIV